MTWTTGEQTVAERYEVETRPETRLGLLFGSRPCLRVTVIDRAGGWVLVGMELTKRRDMDEARAVAARMISDWERDHSEVLL